MRKKQPIPFSEKFLGVDPSVLKLLQSLLAFNPKDRPTAEEEGAQPKYFIVYCQLIKILFSGYCDTLNIISISGQKIMT
jgi:hypothetical protein